MFFVVRKLRPGQLRTIERIYGSELSISQLQTQQSGDERWTHSMSVNEINTRLHTLDYQTNIY